MFSRKLWEAPLALTFSDVILLPGWTTVEPRETVLETRISANVALKIPIVGSPMDTVTEAEMAIALARLGGIGVIHRNMSVEEQVEQALKVKRYAGFDASTAAVDGEGRLLVAAAVSPFDVERAKRLEKHVDVLVTDVAHFHNANAFAAVRRLIGEVGVDVVVGNIGTYQAAEDVVTRLEGVAGLRVGISSGSICSTGEVTGVAAPTLFAVAQAADALRDYGADLPIIADGGVRGPGDAVKALAAGASTVMLGYALAGTEEAAGRLVEINGRKYKEYRGMASPSARARRFARDRYAEKPAKDIAEGVEGLVPYRGAVEGIVREFVAGIQAAMGYVGARNIRKLWDKARFARVTELGRREISPHSILRRPEDQNV